MDVVFRSHSRPITRSPGGFSLTEIVLALFLLALAFLPIIGVMGTSIEGTQKDEEVITAVHLAQTLLNTALQFPFNELPAQAGGSGPTWTLGGATPFSYKSPSGNLTLRLGPLSEKRLTCTAELQITDLPVKFRVPVYSPPLKASDSNDPTRWGWADPPLELPKSELTNHYHRYLIIIRWNDSRRGPRFYSLASFKARLVD